MNSVNIAVSTNGTGSAIDASTMKSLTFSGNASVTMNARSTVVSDPIAFTLTPSMRVAITIYYGQAANTTDMTGHVGSRTNSYILSGDQTSSAAFSGATTVAHWYTINTIDVLAPSTAGCVATLGNSITDGYGLSGGLQNRWTDMFSQALLNNSATAQVGVLNLGIGGTNVAGTGATTGAARYQQDILNQSGVRWVIIFYGINDIAGGASAATITTAYAKFVTDGHAKNMKVYGATITPVNGNSYFTAAHEAVRSAVNKWIRTAGNFDGFIDFDKTIRNPTDTTRLQAAYSNDWLHPNAAGYKLLGESIDLNLFIGSDTTTLGVNSLKAIDGYALGQNYPNPFNPSTEIRFSIGTYGHISLCVYDLLGREMATLVNEKKSTGTYTVTWNAAATIPSGVYFYRLSVVPSARRDLVPTDGRDTQAGNYTKTKKLVLLR
jgi:lysophospholipase L1-like esterase